MDKKFANYTIQNIPRDSWIKFRVILAKNSMQAAKVFRDFIEEFNKKNK